MNFKVGDRIKLLPNWNEEDGVLSKSEHLLETHTVLKIKHKYIYESKEVTQIVFNKSGHWAELHEIRHLTPLEELL